MITDRASMVDALADAGFDLPRIGKAYITARDPDTGERWRLKGEIFHEDWQAEARSTNRLQSQMDGLAACVSVLIQSQTASVAALHGLLGEGSNYGKLRMQLETSLKLVKAAEERLKQS